MNSRPVLVASVLAAAVAVLGGCSGDEGDGGPEIADLGTVVVSQAPAGFVPITESFGAFDLDQYVTRFADDAEHEREELAEVGFERGYARGWISPQGIGLVAFVFEVETSRSAEHLLEYYVDEAKDNHEGREFDVEGIEGAEGVTYGETSIEGGETVHAILFVRGKRLYLAASSGGGAGGSPEAAVQFARSQAELAK